MIDATRVVLIDPNAKSRQALQRLLETIDEVELLEVCPVYPLASRRLAALSPELALVGLEGDVEAGLAAVESAARNFPGIAVVAVGPNDSALILRSIRAGAREFLPLPASKLELVEMARRIGPHSEPQFVGSRGPQTIAVTGAAGGVGCSTFAVNLAATLAKLSRRDTVLADFDLLFGSVEEALGIMPDNSLDYFVRNLDDLEPEMMKRLIPRHACGLYVLTHPVSMEEAAGLEPQALGQVVGMLLDTFASIVIDTSKGFQETDFLAYDQADVILVVFQLTLHSTRNTVRLMQYFRHFEGMAEKVRLVVNRVDSPLSEIGLKKAESLLKCNVSWQIPNATRLFRPARTQGVPIDEVAGGAGSKASAAFLKIARELLPFAVEKSAREKRTLFKAFSR
jgi:pilus assembly protein CpaE